MEWEKVLETGGQVRVNEAEGRAGKREEPNEVALPPLIGLIWSSSTPAEYN